MSSIAVEEKEVTFVLNRFRIYLGSSSNKLPYVVLLS
jgi:hypothetical protein